MATWVLGELTTWAFGWGAERVELNINADNAGSRCVAERCGYVLEGTRRSTYLKPGRRVDTTIWSRLASDHKTVEAPGRAAYGQGTKPGKECHVEGQAGP